MHLANWRAVKQSELLDRLASSRGRMRSLYTPDRLEDGLTGKSEEQWSSKRFHHKGHERPFQRAVIIDVVDGYLNPGD